jgi:hypothetical protein
VPPEARGGGEERIGLIDRGRRRGLLVPGERAEQLFSLAKDMPGTNMIGLDPEQHVGL